MRAWALHRRRRAALGVDRKPPGSFFVGHIKYAKRNRSTPRKCTASRGTSIPPPPRPLCRPTPPFSTSSTSSPPPSTSRRLKVQSSIGGGASHIHGWARAASCNHQDSPAVAHAQRTNAAHRRKAGTSKGGPGRAPPSPALEWQRQYKGEWSQAPMASVRTTTQVQDGRAESVSVAWLIKAHVQRNKM
jgi:hypothetical protein